MGVYSGSRDLRFATTGALRVSKQTSVKCSPSPGAPPLPLPPAQARAGGPCRRPAPWRDKRAAERVAGAHVQVDEVLTVLRNHPQKPGREPGSFVFLLGGWIGRPWSMFEVANVLLPPSLLAEAQLISCYHAGEFQRNNLHSKRFIAISLWSCGTSAVPLASVALRMIKMRGWCFNPGIQCLSLDMVSWKILFALGVEC